MEQSKLAEMYAFGDQTMSDVTVCLKNIDGKPEWFPCHSVILKRHSQYFADLLSKGHPSYQSIESNNCIEVHCTQNEYESYVKLLKLLYLPEESVSDSWESVKSVLGVLRASVALQCRAIIQSCILYLEAVPWEEDEEEEIVRLAPSLGPDAQPLLARMQPVDSNATKNVLLSAIHFATTTASSLPPFTDELKTSAQEQVEYMLLEDEDTPLVAVDEEVKSEVSTGLSRMFTKLETVLNMLSSGFDESPEAAEQQLLQSLSDLEWMCNILPKMEMMKEFVSGWAYISDRMLGVIQDDKYSSSLWSVKAKLIEMTGKALDAIGYGSVVLPAPFRLHFLKTWLPYIRKLKPLLDAKSLEDESFPYKMDNDLCQNIEGAITSLVLALPSNDQADILADWMKKIEQLNYPDLTEAFEVWCYRTKTAKRRVMVGLKEAGNPTAKLRAGEATQKVAKEAARNKKVAASEGAKNGICRP
ncbi:BTB/POZ domain-containing protein [Canna indica]|uniref:BTB/POZ domain-containing protein n=1 Tax=Canna indica TaxID=4628 RepID=A0AAQ3KZT5_9LILI|nr:BTB/POZ domain-containing protein [Canna indica]